MVDAHCHLNFHSFEEDYDTVIKAANAAGIHTIINAGTQVSSSQWAVDLAEKYDNLYAVIAIHPHHADKVGVESVEGDWFNDLDVLAKNPKVVGIGECGLDYYNYKSNGIVDPKIQKEVFIRHIELAHKHKLPFQIHTRDEKARLDALDIIKSHKNQLQQVPGMFHCMAGSVSLLKKALDLGFYIGFDGNITYDGPPPGEPTPLIDLVRYAPLERIVIETDSPYLTPNPRRGQRNEPKYAIITAEFIAQVKGVSLEKVVEQTDKNVYTIFKLIRPV